MIWMILFLVFGIAQAQDYSPFWTLPIERQKSLLSGFESQQIGQTQKQERWIGFAIQNPNLRYGVEFIDQMDQGRQGIKLSLGQKQWLGEISLGSELEMAQFELNQNWNTLALWQSLSYRNRSLITEQSYLHSTDEFQILLGGEFNYNQRISLGLGSDFHHLDREFAPDARNFSSLRSAFSFFILGTNQGVNLPISPIGLRSSWKRQGLIYESALEQHFWGDVRETDAINSLQCALQKEHWGFSFREFYAHGIEQKRNLIGSDFSANLLLGTWSSQIQFGQTRPLLQRNTVWNLSVNFKKLFYQP